MESVRELVFFSLRKPPKVHDWSSAFFLQERLEHRLSPSTLEVCVADAVDGRSLGKHDLIVRWVPVQAGLQRGPFELLDSAELKFLSAKTALLTALTSISRGSGTSKHFRWAKSALCSGGPTLTLSWDSGLDTCLRFPPRPSVISWWTCKHCPRRRQIQPLHCCVP